MEGKTKKLYLSVVCQTSYNSSIEVPEDMTLEEALIYAKEHLSEVPIQGGLEYITDSDVLDEENCFFE